LEYNETTKQWQYPTNDGKPLEWSKESSIYKVTQVLCSSASMGFYALFASFEDRDKHFKIVAYATFDKDKTPFEIRSDEFACF
jgi:hypothetical protein